MLVLQKPEHASEGVEGNEVDWMLLVVHIRWTLKEVEVLGYQESEALE